MQGTKVIMLTSPYRQILSDFLKDAPKIEGMEIVGICNGQVFEYKEDSLEAYPYGMVYRKDDGPWLSNKHMNYKSDNWVGVFINQNGMKVWSHQTQPDKSTQLAFGSISCTRDGKIDNHSTHVSHNRSTARVVVGFRDDKYIVSGYNGTVPQTRIYALANGLKESVIMDGGGSAGILDGKGKLIFGYNSRPIANALVFYRPTEKKEVDNMNYQKWLETTMLTDKISLADIKCKGVDLISLDEDVFYLLTGKNTMQYKLWLRKTKIAPNFSLYELACKNRRELKLNEDAYNHALDVQKVRDKFGPQTANSWYRSTVHNESVKGSPTSQHPLMVATDIKCYDQELQQKISDYWHTLKNGKGGIGRYKNFIHLDSRVTKSRWDYR